MNCLRKLTFLGPALILLTACQVYVQTYQPYPEILPTTKNQNVCRLLKDSIIIYAVFVDASEFHPWSEYDIESTLDSIERATNWLSDQARMAKKHIGINIVNHKQRGKLSISERQAKTGYPLNTNRFESNKKSHLIRHQFWVDQISKHCGRAIKKPNSSKIATGNKIRNSERLVAALRTKYKTDNIALMFFVNGYFENKKSYAFHTSFGGSFVEYAIITNKNPSVIAHEFLHLFGAVDLYPNHQFSNFNELSAKYPNEVMRVVHKDLSKLQISPITKYFIGWQDSLDHYHTRMLFHKSNLIDY